MSKTNLKIIVGPTAIGKTYYSIKIAQKYNGEIISADSMQIYKHLNIGTAKPSKEELQQIPHHLINIINPDEPFDLFKYINSADSAINEIKSKNKIPFIIGGTGMYVKGLIEGIFNDVSSDPSVRMELYNKADNIGLDSLYQELRNIDPEAADKIMSNDRQRIIRALEVYSVSGKTISELQRASQSAEKRYDFKIVALNMDREILYDRIEKRIDLMFENGFIDEVKFLIDKGYASDLLRIKAIGYKEVIEYLNGVLTLDEAIDQIKKFSRNYAKRQFTWFRAMKYITWLDITNLNEDEILSKIEDILFRN